MPDHWMPGDPWTLEDVQDELDLQRKSFGLEPLRKKTIEDDEFVSKEWGDYNRSVYVGVDLGKKADHSAAVIIEPFRPHGREEKYSQFTYHVSRIKRYDLEIPYPKIARALQKIDAQLRDGDDWEYIYYIIDEGGVGTGVTDQVVELIPNANVYRVTLTGGVRAKWINAREVHLPKTQMASTLIALFEAGRIWIRDKETKEILRQELLDYELKISKVGHDQFGAMKMGAHDDITTAIGMATWVAEDNGGGSVPTIW